MLVLNEIWPWHVGLRWAIVALWATWLIVQGLLKTFTPWVYEVIISITCRNVSKTCGVNVNFRDVASAMNIFTISFLYSDYTSYSKGLLKQTWRCKSFLHAQGFDLCSSSKRCVYHTHILFLEDEQCLLKKLYLRSENDTAKEMHAVTHSKENMKDKKREKNTKC